MVSRATTTRTSFLSWRHNNINLQTITYLVMVFLCISWFVSSSSSSSSTETTASWLRGKQQLSTIFSLLVTLDFQSTDVKNQFLQDIQPVAEHVRNHEPDTLAYKILLSDQDPLKVMIVERYKDKDHAYLGIHKSSVPFLQFRQKLQTLQDNGQVTISGHSYLDSNFGFI